MTAKSDAQLEHQYALAGALAAIEGRLTAAVDSIRGLVVNGVLFTGTVKLDANGMYTATWEVPFGCVAVGNSGAAAVTFANESQQASAPTAGVGVFTIDPGKAAVFPVAGRALTIYGTAGALVQLGVYDRPVNAALFAPAVLGANDAALSPDFTAGTPSVSHGYVYDGAQWRKAYVAAAVGDAATLPNSLSVGLWGYNGATWDRLRVDANKKLLVATAPPGNTAVINDTRNAQGVTYVGPDVAVDAYANLAVDINVNTLTGTGPTAQLIIDRKGADGIYYPISTGTVLNAAGAQSTTIGPGCTVPQAFGTIIRYRVVIGGVGPSASWTLSVYGR